MKEIQTALNVCACEIYVRILMTLVTEHPVKVGLNKESRILFYEIFSHGVNCQDCFSGLGVSDLLKFCKIPLILPSLLQDRYRNSKYLCLHSKTSRGGRF